MPPACCLSLRAESPAGSSSPRVKAELISGNVALNFQHFLLLYSEQAAASNKEAGLGFLFSVRLWERLEKLVVCVGLSGGGACLSNPSGRLLQ